MQQSDFNRFRTTMAGIAEVFGKDLSAPLLDAYWLALRDWSLEDFERAAGHLLSTLQFMPKPADFTALRKEPATEAWLRAREAVEYTPQGYVIKRDAPPSLAATIRAIGGANVLMLTPEDKIGFVQRRFVEAYRDVGDETESAVRGRLVDTARKLVDQSSSARAGHSEADRKSLRFDAQQRDPAAVAEVDPAS